jgi:hypothetical protein
MNGVNPDTGWIDYRVDGETVNGIAAAMAKAESVFQATGVIVAIVELLEDEPEGQ